MQLTSQSHSGRGNRRAFRAPLVLVVLLSTFTLAITGCTASNETGGKDTGGKPPKSSAAALQSSIRTSGKPVTVLADDNPAAMSASVSKALFATAPVVVIAAADDRSGIDGGAEQAGRLGVPLLLLAGDRSAAATPPASPSATTQLPEAQLPRTLTAEITRLGARNVLAMGAAVSTRLDQLAGVDVVTDPAKLPAVSAAKGADTVAALVRSGRKGDDASAMAAAQATAKAAGAQVISVAGTDLRADSAAIKALAKQRPDRVLAVGAGFGPVEQLAKRLRVAKTGTLLPGGGQMFFPGHRLVALYGHPGTPGLGVLGEQGLTASIARAKKMAAQYDSLSSVPVVPTFEIIATTAQGSAGPDGDYSGESSVAELRPWVEKAGDAGVYVVLDLQPGRANFLDQAKLYADLLRQPNVGLALDPEWRLGPGQLPLGQIGGVDASEINSVTSWLADLTAKNKLPQKLLVLHQFRLSMIRNEKQLTTDTDEVQLLIHMDGQGATALKDGTWQAVTHAAPKGIPFGWKNFYDEDDPMLSPAQTMTKKPTPVMISYQ